MIIIDIKYIDEITTIPYANHLKTPYGLSVDLMPAYTEITKKRENINKIKLDIMSKGKHILVSDPLQSTLNTNVGLIKNKAFADMKKINEYNNSLFRLLRLLIYLLFFKIIFYNF